MKKGIFLPSLIGLLALSCTVQEIEPQTPPYEPAPGDDVFYASLAPESDTKVYVDEHVSLADLKGVLASFARDRATSARRRWAKLSVPFYVVFDAAALVTAFFVMLYVMQFPVTKIECRVALPIRVTASFAFLIFFRTYVTVWSRAMTSNFARMLVACAAGAVAGSIGLCCAPNVVPDDVAPAEIAGATLVYFLVSFLLIAAARLARPVVRDVFYSLDCSRLKGRKDVSRVLVYGAGLRYRAYRRELVRTTNANDRMIVGLMDDDILLRG